MPCLNDYDYEVLLQHITYEQAELFIRERYWETYYFEPGYRVLGLRVLGDTAVPVAIEDKSDDAVIFPYTKPCMGTFVLRFPGVSDEVKRIRSSYSKSLTLKRWTGSGGKKSDAVAITCPMDVSLRNFNYDILSHFRTLKECENYMISKYPETYYFEPDFKVLGLKPLGKEYVPVSIEEGSSENIVFPYYDSGMGALVIRVKGVPDEVERIKENYSKELTARKRQESASAGSLQDGSSGATDVKERQGTISRILRKVQGDPDNPRTK